MKKLPVVRSRECEGSGDDEERFHAGAVKTHASTSPENLSRSSEGRTSAGFKLA